jgi:hypothetical protein
MSSTPSGGAPRATCWHCQLATIAITWRPSAKYPGAYAGYVHRAKVCAVFPRGREVKGVVISSWEGKVFLTIDDRLPVEPFSSREDAEQWCTETVQQWFGQLDHQ